MTSTTITWQDGQIETFNGIGQFKTVPKLVSHYKIMRQQYCLHSRTEGIKHPKCTTCGLILQ